MATMVALILVSAHKMGPKGMALGFVVCAAIVFVLKDWAGRESSFYSFPVRYWPPLFLLFALLMLKGL